MSPVNYIKKWCSIACFISGLVVFGQVAATELPRANLKGEQVSGDTWQMANWILASNDNKRMPFIIIDKKAAKVFVFTSDGNLSGATTALLGAATGDDSVPGIGEKEMSKITPEERTTPAGRFGGYIDKGIHGEDILWIDYDLALSLHRVVTSNPKEQRIKRLASKKIEDKRISYGCVNVPVPFYEKVVVPAFKGVKGVVYILPEIKSLQQVFTNFSQPDDNIQTMTRK